MNGFRHIAIFGRKKSNEIIFQLQQLIDELVKKNIEVFLFDALAKSGLSHYHSEFSERSVEGESFDLAISVGGDGTLLETLTYIDINKTPVLGVNAGRMGFLATTPLESVKEAIHMILDNQFSVEKRNLITLDSHSDLFNSLNYGLNEFAILKTDTSSMILVHSYLDGKFLNSYWADGLIVSTPSGSTGYSLSCGGPLVMPTNDSFIIAPVNPHNLNVRPLVVPDDVVLSFEVECRNRTHLVSLDSRSKTLEVGEKLVVRKSDHSLKLISFDSLNYFDTLRKKLNWGLDFRN